MGETSLKRGRREDAGRRVRRDACFKGAAAGSYQQLSNRDMAPVGDISHFPAAAMGPRAGSLRLRVILKLLGTAPRFKARSDASGGLPAEISGKARGCAANGRAERSARRFNGALSRNFRIWWGKARPASSGRKSACRGKLFINQLYF
jgi:hypothetical protein